MRKQTRTRIIREKTETLCSLIDACNTIKSITEKSDCDRDIMIDMLTDLWIRLEKRICEHLPSTVEEADIQRLFLNNTVKQLGTSVREIDHNEGMQFICSFNRMVQFYRQCYQKSIDKSNLDILSSK